MTRPPRDVAGDGHEAEAGRPSGRVRAAAALAWRAHRTAALGAAAMAVLMGCVPVAAAWFTKLAIDALARHAAGAELGPIALALGLTSLLVAVAPAFAQYAQDQLRRALQVSVTGRLFDAVNSQPGLRHFENPAFHDRIRLAQEAGQNAPQQIVQASLSSGQQAVTLVGFIGSLLLLAPLMVPVVVIAALPALRAQLGLSRRRARMMWGITGHTRRQFFFANLLTGTPAAKEIRLFGLGDHLRARLLGELRTANDAEQALARRTLRTHGLLSLLGVGVGAGGLVWAIMSAGSGRMSVGDLAVFIAAVSAVQTALSTIVAQYAEAHNALLMFGHYLHIVRAAPDLPVPASPRPVPALRQGIELRDVWFRYDPDHPWAVRGVDLFIPHGKAVALVGLNGAGKSTLVKLLCRLYDPTLGSITWDGVDLRDLSPADVRDRIGVVFQDYMSYDLTAAENIRLGDLATAGDRDRVVRAAKLAGVHETLAALPRGYDTMLSRIFSDNEDPSAGVMLSGGQWQRLALARALMRDGRDLLILDEPTSGLDARAEDDIHRSLLGHRQGRTSVLISHRLNAVRDADIIAVLADGEITERGTHHELLRSDGTYAELFGLQARGYDTSPESPDDQSRLTTTPSTRS